MVKFCGYEVGTEISVNEVARLRAYLVKVYGLIDFAQATQEELNAVARANERKWRDKNV